MISRTCRCLLLCGLFLPSATPLVNAQIPPPTATGSTAEAASATPPVVKLSLPQHWNNSLGSGVEAMRELLGVLSGYSEPDDSLDITEFPEIKHGVTLMMPLPEALEKLRIKQLLPSRQSVAFPGIPFSYRIFTNPEKDEFNLIYVITDMADRVVGLQYVSETPRQGIYGSYGSERPSFFYYNYINNRKRALRSLSVTTGVRSDNHAILCLQTSLYDQRQFRTLETVHWYLPRRIACLIRFNLESQLARSPIR